MFRHVDAGLDVLEMSTVLFLGYPVRTGICRHPAPRSRAQQLPEAASGHADAGRRRQIRGR